MKLFTVGKVHLISGCLSYAETMSVLSVAAENAENRTVQIPHLNFGPASRGPKLGHGSFGPRSFGPKLCAYKSVIIPLISPWNSGEPLLPQRS